MKERENGNVQAAEGGITRRDFIKGAAIGVAGLAVAGVLPGCSPDTQPADNLPDVQGAVPGADSGKAGIFLKDGADNLDGSALTLEYTKPLELEGYLDGETGREAGGVWRTSDKKLVTVDQNGVVRQKDTVGGNQVEITYAKGDTEYKLTLNTATTVGAETLAVDTPLTRAEFASAMTGYFGWIHYNKYYDDGIDMVEKTRTFDDVVGDAWYVEDVEAALDAGILTPVEDNNFYPEEPMAREDAAVILCRAFLLAPAAEDQIAGFSDVGEISGSEQRDALNTLVAKGFLCGRTAAALAPKAGITRAEVDRILNHISNKMVAPVQVMPKDKQMLYRCYINMMCPTPGARVFYTLDGTEPTEDSLEYIEAEGRPLITMINTENPAQRNEQTYTLKVKAVKPGLEDSPTATYTWNLYRPPVNEYVIDKLHDGSDTFPAVYRFYDYFQAGMFYIEGSRSGLLFDTGMPAYNEDFGYANLKTEVDKIATKPYIVVVGHGHIDHHAGVKPFYDAGIPIYENICDVPATAEYTGIDQSEFLPVDEGDSFDLGNIRLDVYRLPGHTDGLILLQDKANGIIFSTDIFGCTRYHTADMVAVSGVKMEVLLSLTQQVYDNFERDGGWIGEVYTGHNRVAVSRDNLINYERAIQQVVDYGDDAVVPSHRSAGLPGQSGGGGAKYSVVGDMYTNSNWMALSIGGNIGDPETYLQYDRGTVPYLSNLNVVDGVLEGHDFTFNEGENSVLKNKFVPWDADYTVKVPAGQSSVTIVPTTMSTLATMQLDGKDAVSRTPYVIQVGGGGAAAQIQVTAPDGGNTMTYNLTFTH